MVFRAASGTNFDEEQGLSTSMGCTPENCHAVVRNQARGFHSTWRQLSTVFTKEHRLVR